MSDPHDPWPTNAVTRWDLNAPPEPRPFRWVEGSRPEHFPYGVAFEAVQPELGNEYPSWGDAVSIAEMIGSHTYRPPEALLWALDRDGQRVGKPWRLRGPFHILHEAGRPSSITAHGGIIEQQEPQVLTARTMRLTPLDADGNPTGPGKVIKSMADVLVNFTPVVEEATVALGHIGRAAISMTMDLKRFAFARLWNAFYVADRVISWTRDGRRVWVHRSWLRPGPAMGLTRRQRRARRRIHRRGTR